MPDENVDSIINNLQKLEDFVSKLPVSKLKVPMPKVETPMKGSIIGEDPMVHHPDHYKLGGIEAIEVMEAKLTPREFIGAMKSQVLKYTMRASYKGKEKQDLEKAEWYSKRLIDYLRNLDELPPV